jgi:hypothetical protein
MLFRQTACHPLQTGQTILNKNGKQLYSQFILID